MISVYESGRREPSLPTLTRLIEATGHTVEIELVASPGCAQGHPDSPRGGQLRQRRRAIPLIAAMLGLSRPTVDRLVADGRLPSVDLGPTRRTLIPAWAIEELVAGPAAGHGVDQTSSGLAT